MAATPIAIVIPGSPSSPSLKVYDPATSGGAAEATVSLTQDATAAYLWRGTINESISGDKLCIVESGGAEYFTAGVPFWIHNLEDSTSLQFVTPVPPSPHYSNVKQVDDLDAVLASLPLVTLGTGTQNAAFRPAYLVAYVEESKPKTVECFDEFGNAIDVSGVGDLGVYFETEQKQDVETIISGITVGGAGNNQVTFDLTTNITEIARKLLFSVRLQSAPRTVYAGGILEVVYLPGSEVPAP